MAIDLNQLIEKLTVIYEDRIPEGVVIKMEDGRLIVGKGKETEAKEKTRSAATERVSI